MYWDCPRCGAENSLEATSCRNCGYQYFPGYQGPASSEVWSRQLRDSVSKQRETIRGEIEKSLDHARERSEAALDPLGGTSTDKSPKE